MQYECDSCGFVGPKEAFHPAKDLHERIDEGGPYTDVECPLDDCGALAYPQGEQK